jgi:hypothetical protein
MRIQIPTTGFNSDPDPAFFQIADLDPGLIYELNSNFFRTFFSNFFLLLIFLSS